MTWFGPTFSYGWVVPEGPRPEQTSSRTSTTPSFVEVGREGWRAGAEELAWLPNGDVRVHLMGRLGFMGGYSMPRHKEWPPRELLGMHSMHGQGYVVKAFGSPLNVKIHLIVALVHSLCIPSFLFCFLPSFLPLYASVCAFLPFFLVSLSGTGLCCQSAACEESYTMLAPCPPRNNYKALLYAPSFLVRPQSHMTSVACHSL
eukprot:jgi/Botrbrau1/21887/Bobra.0249s0016.1